MNKERNLLLFILLIFGLIYSSISLVNHYYFRTYAFDLGIFNQAIYHYSQFQLNANTVRVIQVQNLLSDHLSLILIPFSFGRYLFGSYTLLIIQIAALLFGGYGCYRYIRSLSKSSAFSFFAMLQYFLFIGIYSALSFDYHNNVVAAGLIPWFLLFLKNHQYKKALAFALLIMSCKENMALLVMGLSIGYAVFERGQLKRNRLRRFGIGFLGFTYFILAMKVVMPALADEGYEYEHFIYSVLGENLEEGFMNLIKQPIKYIKLLFINHFDDPINDQLKSNFWIYFSLSGGLFCFLNPKFLPAAVLILMQKMFNDDPTKWGMAMQYNIAFASLVSLAVFEYIHRIKALNPKYITAGLVVLCTASTTYYCIENDRMGWIDKNNLRFYNIDRYKSELDLKTVHEEIAKIPESANVSAESRLVSHLAFRDKIYVFPWIYDADYIVLLPNDKKYYPLQEDSYKEELAKYSNSNEWSIFYEDKDLLIFERIDEQDDLSQLTN